MKTVWQGHVVQATSKYGEHAPMAAVCCNACRTCATTNVIAVGVAAVGGAAVWLSRLVSRSPRHS